MKLILVYNWEDGGAGHGREALGVEASSKQAVEDGMFLTKSGLDDLGCAKYVNVFGHQIFTSDLYYKNHRDEWVENYTIYTLEEYWDSIA